MLKKKSQVTFDYMITLVLALVFFTFILELTYQRLKITNDVIASNQARRIAKKIAYDINDVYLVGSGSAKNVTVMETLKGGLAYTITVYPKSVVVTYYTDNRRDYSWKILTKDVNGSVNGLNVVPGDIRLSNSNGTIFIIPTETTTSTSTTSTSTTTTSTSTTSTTILTCQEACSGAGYGTWQCRTNCGGQYPVYEATGDADCGAKMCCCGV